jgi:hypothetical protein
LSCIIDGKLPELLEPPTKKWGNAGHIISVDDTIKVLIEAVKKVKPQDYVVIPESFMLDMEMKFVRDEDEEYQKERIDELLIQYKDKIDKILKYKDKKRIYVCVNSSKWLNGPSHQNFICVMIKTKQIIRFEPTTNNTRLEAFGIGKFWKQVAKDHGYTYEVIEKAFWLNVINACRLNSLILALNHILDISIETFLGCFGLGIDPPDFLHCDDKTLTKFNFTVQDQLYEFLEDTNPLPLPRQPSTRLKKSPSRLKTDPDIPPPKKRKTRLVFRSKKKSKLKKSKKINKQ